MKFGFVNLPLSLAKMSRMLSLECDLNIYKTGCSNLNHSSQQNRTEQKTEYRLFSFYLRTSRLHVINKNLLRIVRFNDKIKGK